MANVERTTGTYPERQQEADVSTLYDAHNLHDAGTLAWTSVKTGTLVVTSTSTLNDNLTFSPATKGIVGTVAADDATAGNVGEHTSAALASGSAVSLSTTNTYVNVTSLSLSAGDWDVQGVVLHNLNGATMTIAYGVISLYSANTTTDHVLGVNLLTGYAGSANLDSPITLPRYRVNVSSPTTVYLKAAATKSAGTPKAYGSITARRIR